VEERRTALQTNVRRPRLAGDREDYYKALTKPATSKNRLDLLAILDAWWGDVLRQQHGGAALDLADAAQICGAGARLSPRTCSGAQLRSRSCASIWQIRCAGAARHRCAFHRGVRCLSRPRAGGAPFQFPEATFPAGSSPMHRLLIILAFLAVYPVSAIERPPNILFAIADDWGLHASAYRHALDQTPAFDRVAPRRTVVICEPGVEIPSGLQRCGSHHADPAGAWRPTCPNARWPGPAVDAHSLVG
jgi:hypothetical protein